MEYTSTLGTGTLTVEIPETVEGNCQVTLTGFDINVPKQQLRDTTYQLLGLLMA